MVNSEWGSTAGPLWFIIETEIAISCLLFPLWLDNKLISCILLTLIWLTFFFKDLPFH